jgi:hypothetical protein
MTEYGVIKLLFNDDKGHEQIRLYKTIGEAKNAIKMFRRSGLYHNYRIKVVKQK